MRRKTLALILAISLSNLEAFAQTARPGPAVGGEKWGAYPASLGAESQEKFYAALHFAPSLWPFIQLMGKTALAPSDIAGKPLEAQIAAMTAAVNTYAFQVIKDARQALTANDQLALKKAHWELTDLNHIRTLLPAEAKQYVFQYHEIVGMNIEKSWKAKVHDMTAHWGQSGEDAAPAPHGGLIHAAAARAAAAQFPGNIPAALAALASKDEDLALSAAKFLSKAELTPSQIDAAAQHLASPDAQERRMARIVFSKHNALGNSPSALLALVQGALLGDSENEAALQSVELKDHLLKTLLAALDSPHKAQRLLAARLLSSAGLPEKNTLELVEELAGARGPELDALSKALSRAPVLPASAIAVLRGYVSATTPASAPARLAALSLLGAQKSLDEAHWTLLARALLDADSDLRYEAYDQLSRKTDLPETALLILADALDDPRHPDGARSRAAKVLSRQDPLADSAFKRVLEQFLKAGPERGQYALSVLMNAQNFPQEIKDRLLAALGPQNAPELQKALIEILEPRSRAEEILRLLSPVQAGQLAELIADFDKIPAKGLSSAGMSNPQTLGQFIDYLTEMRRILDAQEYALLTASMKSLSAWKIKVILSPGAVEHAASDGEYRLPYAVKGLKLSETKRPPLYAVVSGGRQADEKIQKSFAAFETLIEANFSALGILGSHAGALTKQAGRAILEQVGRMLASYRVLAGGEPGELESRYAEIQKELEALWADLPEKALLPPAVAARLSELEPGEPKLESIRNVNTFINHVHQASFKALLKASKGAGGAGTISIGERQVSLLNAGAEPVLEKARLAHPAVRALLAGGKDVPKGLIVLKGDQIAYHAKLGFHSAEILVKLAEPDEGGFLRMRYSESGSKPGNKLRMRYLARVLELLGASSKHNPQTTYMDAFWDKDHGLLSKAQLEKALPLLLGAMTNSYNLDFALTDIHGKGKEKGQAVADAMADAMLAEGRVPFFGNGASSGLWDKHKAYASPAKRAARNELRSALDAELLRLGLPKIGPGAFGQRVIDEKFTAPIARAAARGEIVFEKGSPRRADYRPIDALAQAVLANEQSALQLSGVLQSIDPAALEFEAIGAVGRLRAERAQWLDAGRGAVIYVLRDPDSGAPAYARAQSWDGKALSELDAPGLLALARARGLDAAPGPPPGKSDREKRAAWLRAPPAPKSGWHAVRGLAASSGRGGFATARVSFRGDAAPAGTIFAAPFTSPDDIEAMRRSAGVITTGGGLLSHAAITTRELGLPAVIVPQARWQEKPASLVFLIETPGPARGGPGGLRLIDTVKRRLVILEEGDLVRLSGADGALTLFSHKKADKDAVAKTHDHLSKPGAALADWSWLKPLAPQAQASAVRFAIEEALGNKAYAQESSRIIAGLMAAGPGARKAVATHGKRMLQERLSSLAQADFGALQKNFTELSALAATLKLDSKLLKPLESRLQSARAAHEAEQKIRAQSLQQRVGQWAARTAALEPSHLVELRRLLRKAASLDASAELTALKAKFAQLAGLKKQAIAQAGAAAIALDKVDDDYTEFIGGKSAKLGEMMRVVARLGGVVPGGVALTTNAYDRFLKESGLSAKVAAQARAIDALLEGADLNSPAVLSQVKILSARIQDLIKSARPAADSGVGREILESLRAAGVDKELLAVRSSAIQEDSDEAAFAGAAETYLYVGYENVLEKVVENWASFWLPRGIIYRRQQGIRSVELQPAVTIQKMVDAEAAGVLFTVNPVTQKREIVINAAYGLGEGVVSGLVQADQYTADLEGEETSAPVIGDKKLKIVRKAAGGGTEEKTVPAKERRKRALSPEQVSALVKIAAALKDHFGFPLDIEFAVENGKIAILQARPVTTAPVK